MTGTAPPRDTRAHPTAQDTQTRPPPHNRQKRKRTKKKEKKRGGGGGVEAQGNRKAGEAQLQHSTIPILSTTQNYRFTPQVYSTFPFFGTLVP